jgi:hypothetical protein
MCTFMRLFGDGKHGRVERIQTFRCQACRTTFTCPTQLAPVSSENPFLSRRLGTDHALVEGLDPIS